MKKAGGRNEGRKESIERKTNIDRYTNTQGRNVKKGK